MYVSLYVLSHSHFPYIKSTENVNAAFTSEGISIEKTRITKLEGRRPGISPADQIATTITSNFTRKTHEIMVSLSLQPGNHSVISCMC